MPLEVVPPLALATGFQIRRLAVDLAIQSERGLGRTHSRLLPDLGYVKMCQFNRRLTSAHWAFPRKL
jgi:hypothetical protein